MINANETNLAAIDVLDGSLPEEEIHEVSLCHGAHEIWRCKKERMECIPEKLGHTFIRRIASLSSYNLPKCIELLQTVHFS